MPLSSPKENHGIQILDSGMGVHRSRPTEEPVKEESQTRDCRRVTHCISAHVRTREAHGPLLTVKDAGLPGGDPSSAARTRVASVDVVGYEEQMEIA